MKEMCVYCQPMSMAEISAMKNYSIAADRRKWLISQLKADSRLWQLNVYDSQ